MIEMSVKSQTVIEVSLQPVVPLSWVPHCGLVPSLDEVGSVATVFLKVRQFFKALKGPPRQMPAGGGPGEPESYTAADSIWNDPAFWMMLNH
jgi:hypothetical protein